MTDTEREALCKRIDELCQENERLRELADGAANEADRLTHDAAALQIENAKLRMLLSSYWKAVHSPVTPNISRDYIKEMRELGIEVD